MILEKASAGEATVSSPSQTARAAATCLCHHRLGTSQAMQGRREAGRDEPPLLPSALLSGLPLSFLLALCPELSRSRQHC